ncbi:hypothetical protein CDAR_10891 [Caerostris darwini]|uniref:Uncharacterized protein n=1 Tax=Caerostris darwini TaxID=1538125 RepID=A0AAV4WAB5_9ARAC|nr:hypothetical protein CDAR_10891 [Caerostris darwini]
MDHKSRDQFEEISLPETEENMKVDINQYSIPYPNTYVHRVLMYSTLTKYVFCLIESDYFSKFIEINPHHPAFLTRGCFSFPLPHKHSFIAIWREGCHVTPWVPGSDAMQPNTAGNGFRGESQVEMHP